MKKRSLIILFLALSATPVLAGGDKKIRALLRQREELQAAYQRDEQDIKDISIRIHDIDTELQALRKRSG